MLDIAKNEDGMDRKLVPLSSNHFPNCPETYRNILSVSLPLKIKTH